MLISFSCLLIFLSWFWRFSAIVMAQSTCNITSWIRKASLYKVTVVTILCAVFYMIGFCQDLRGHVPTAVTTSDHFIACRSLLSNTTTLDFTAHHYHSDNPSLTARVFHLPPCDPKFVDYTPCDDAQRSLKFDRDRLVYRERHCPGRDELLKCRVPAPFGYKVPFRWPESRDFVWFDNVPHKQLTIEKTNQNWVRFEGDRFRFPGGGTMFPGGADAYVDEIAKLINLKDGSIRTAIYTGCEVASFGAYLLSRNILTMSFAPKDTREVQVQFALERGIPALIGVMASMRLPYPSRSFDMAHCSHCLIPWGQHDGQYLLEVDRILRPGGYWILLGPPINWQNRWKSWGRSREDLNSEQTSIEDVAKSICWKKLIQEGDIAIWQKPANHIHCKAVRKVHKQPSFCQGQDPDTAWYTKLETCLTPLPEVSNVEDISGGELAKWPERLTAIPPRISRENPGGVTAEIFLENTELWKKRVEHYKTIDYWLAEPGRYRNVLDMNAYLGGFAAALVNDPIWVMNTVPVAVKINTLGVIYERGLIGTYQNWCEVMSTYPRTYDFIHADSIFSLYQDRCEMEDILLEMDRILRPEGGVIIRDDEDMILKIKSIADAMEWDSRIIDHKRSPHEREQILHAVKQYWTSPEKNS